MAPIKVLLIEDEQLPRETFVTFLAQTPELAVLGGVKTVEEAMASDVTPDVVVLDLELDGGRILKEKANRALAQKWPDAHVLVLTRSQSRHDLLNMIETGARGYVSKFDTSAAELKDAIVKVAAGGIVITPRLAVYLLEDDHGRTPERGILSTQEQAVLVRVAEGDSDNEIGRFLSISPKTVQRHLENICKKTGRRRRADLTRLAVSEDLV